jgi:hypothetical protein
VRSGAPVAYLSAKLCSVFPDGTSALVARGLLNLAHRNSSTAPEPLVAGEWYDVDLELEATSWVFPPDHTVRLALAGGDWPNIWPAPGAADLVVDRASLVLTLPELPPDANATTPELALPKPGEPDSDADAEHDPMVWRVEHDVADGVTRCRIAHGTRYEGAHDARVSERYEGDIDVTRDDPASAHAISRARFTVAWGDVKVSSEARLRLRSDATTYHVEVDLDVDEGGQEFARRRWREAIPRRLQ